MDNRARGPCPVELRVEKGETGNGLRKTNQHRIKRWNSANEEKSRIPGITKEDVGWPRKAS